MNIESNDLVNYYRESIAKEFKRKFSDHLDCGAIKSFDYIIKEVLFDLGLESFIEESFPYLESWFKTIHEMNFLNTIINTPNFEELIILNKDEAKLVTNVEERVSIKISEQEYELSLKLIALKNNISWNYSNPFASFDIVLMNTPHRITLINKSITNSNFHRVFLRKISSKVFPITSYCPEGFTSTFIEMIKNKKNIIFAGATGSGKTSLISSALMHVDEKDHTIILEDTNEIIVSSPLFTKLLAYPRENKGLLDYMSYSMRMSPNRIVLGEIRSKEVVPFILAMNTGHKGLLGSIHANSAKDTIDRLCLLFSLYNSSTEIDYTTTLELITRNIDYIVFLKNKKIVEIIELIGNDGKTPIFRDIIFQ